MTTITLVPKLTTFTYEIDFDGPTELIISHPFPSGKISIFDVVGFAQEKTSARHFCALKIAAIGPTISLTSTGYIPQLTDVPELVADNPFTSEGEIFEHFLQKIRKAFPQSFQLTGLEWIDGRYQVKSLA